MTALAITKLDVLAGFDRLLVCTKYRGAEGAEFDYFPYHQTVLHHAVGEYIELPGFSEDLSEVRAESDLPEAARDYLRFVADFVGVPIALVGVGPAREQVIWTEASHGMAGSVSGSDPVSAASAEAGRNHVQRWRRSSSPTRRTTRAGTPITTSRAPTSRVTTAPAATNASSPITTPGVRIAPPPTRQARRKIGPASGSPGAWRPMVWSLVVVTPGPRKT